MRPPARPTFRWRIRGGHVPLGDRTLVMGIVNVTPDSFSDGGRHASAEAAVDHGLHLVEEGADILDVGGESTRPGSDEVPPDEEQRRILPVVRRLSQESGRPISVDTRHAATARAALDAGAHIVNDVSALGDPGMAPVVAGFGAGLILMHMRGQPKTMQRDVHYDDVVQEVARHLAQRARAAEDAGVDRAALVLDPGLGFGKRSGHGIEDNATLLAHQPSLASLEYPLLVGASRKGFLGHLAGGLPVDQRLEASLAAAVLAAWNGAHIVRVHDVEPTRKALAVVDAVRAAGALIPPL